MLQSNQQGSCLTPEAQYIIGKNPNNPTQELLSWHTPSEAAEIMISLMSIVTRTDEYAGYNDEYKADLWNATNLIRAVLFDLQNQTA